MTPAELVTHQVRIRETNKTIAEQKAKERSSIAEHKKRLRERERIAEDFKKFLEPDNFNLKLYKLRELSSTPSYEEVKNILGNISEVELDSLCNVILQTFKHWGKTNSTEWRANVQRTFRGLEPTHFTITPTVVIGTYSHKE